MQFSETPQQHKRYGICLLCINLFPETGTTARVIGFAKALVRYGDNVWIATIQTNEGLTGEDVAELKRSGLRFNCVSLYHRRLRRHALGVGVHRLMVLIKCLAMAKGLIDKHGFDVIYCSPGTNLLGVVLKRVTRATVVADFHAAGHLEQNNKVMRLLSKLLAQVTCISVDPIVVPTPELKAHFVSRRIPPGKIHVVTNTLEIDDFKPIRSRQEVRAELGITDNEMICVFVGNLRANYNIDALRKLHDVSALVSRSTRVRFLVIGDYECKPVLDENFIYTGYVRVLSDFLFAADFAILPIFHNSLGIRSRCILYFASGLPVITTPVGITGMQFVEGAGAAIVRKSVEEIALASLELIHSPLCLMKMKDNCKQVMEKLGNHKLTAQRLHEVFESTKPTHTDL